jgi:hypothetical protein
MLWFILPAQFCQLSLSDGLVRMVVLLLAVLLDRVSRLELRLACGILGHLCQACMGYNTPHACAVSEGHSVLLHKCATLQILMQTIALTVVAGRRVGATSVAHCSR